ncbi:hypothetical protein [Labrys neptuniae]
MTNDNVTRCERNLLQTLVDNFPNKIDLNYFELSNIAQVRAVWGDGEVASAEHLMATLSLMRSQNLLSADFFLDGERHYLWNVCLQVGAYEAFKKRLEGFMSDPSIAFRDLLGSVLRDMKADEPRSGPR